MNHYNKELELDFSTLKYYSYDTEYRKHEILCLRITLSNHQFCLIKFKLLSFTFRNQVQTFVSARVKQSDVSLSKTLTVCYPVCSEDEPLL